MIIDNIFFNYFEQFLLSFKYLVKVKQINRLDFS